MVLLRKRWHFATERSPEKEERLLAFATGGAATPDPIAPDPDEAADTVPTPEKASTNKDAAVPNAVGGIRTDVQAVLEKKESRKQQTEKLKEKSGAFLEMLKVLEEVPKRQDVIDAAASKGESDSLAEAAALVTTEQEKVSQWASVIENLHKWESGEVQPREFFESMKDIYENDDGTPSEIAGRVMSFFSEHSDEIEAYVVIPNMDTTESNLRSWKNGGVKPQAFIGNITSVLQEMPDADTSVLDRLNAYVEAHVQDIGLWEQSVNGEGINASTKEQIIREMGDIADIDALLRQIEHNKKIRERMEEVMQLDQHLEGAAMQMDAREKQFQALEKTLNEMPKKKTDDGTPHTDPHSRKMNILDMLGVEFFTPLQVYRAMKELKEAYVEGYNNWSKTKETRLTLAMGRTVAWAPFGQRLETYLEKRATADDDKRKGEFKETLESKHPTFLELLYNKDSILSKERSDPNHARAVLEYAASKGFLYDLDEGGDLESKTVIGYKLTDLISDYPLRRQKDYVHKLRTDNAGGREHGIKHGEETVHDLDNIPAFMHELDHILEEGNIWEAVGIAQRAIDRGLMAEVSPWILTTVLRHMRENAAVKKYMPQMALDKMGALSFYRAGGWSLGMLKGERKELSQWLKSGEGIEKAGIRGRTIYMLEQEIMQKTGHKFDGPHEKMELDQLVAKVLASLTLSGTVKLFNKKEITFSGPISIFSNKYKDYRNGNHVKMQGDLSPGIGKEDPDYYNEPGDNLLAGATPIAKILAPTGGGKFEHEAFAQNFIGGILKSYRELKQEGLTNEAHSFRREMGRKLTTHFKIVVLDARTSGLPGYNTKQFNKEEEPNELALLTLIKEGFMPVEIFAEVAWVQPQNSGVGMAKQILQQVDPNLAKAVESQRGNGTDMTAFKRVIENWNRSQSILIDPPSKSDADAILVPEAAPPPVAKEKDDK